MTASIGADGQIRKTWGSAKRDSILWLPSQRLYGQETNVQPAQGCRGETMACMANSSSERRNRPVFAADVRREGPFGRPCVGMRGHLHRHRRNFFRFAGGARAATQPTAAELTQTGRPDVDLANHCNSVSAKVSDLGHRSIGCRELLSWPLLRFSGRIECLGIYLLNFFPGVSQDPRSRCARVALRREATMGGP